MTAFSKISGARKAAVLLAIMGEECASSVCRQLSENDIQIVTRELAELRNIQSEVAQAVLEEFCQHIKQDQPASGGMDFASRLLVKAFGQDMANSLLEKVIQHQELNRAELEALQKADPQQLARFLETEHPQTIALVLAHLDGKQAAAVLMKLPPECQADSVKRLAQLRQFSPEIAYKISAVLNRKLLSLGEQGRKAYAGAKSVADIMNNIGQAPAKSILETIERDDPKTAINIRNLMFTFEDLLGVADIAVRELIGSIDKKRLAIALKGASGELKDHIFRAMSSRAVEMLKEDMDALGPVRSKEVAQAQQEAVALLRKLEADGKITLRPEENDEFVV